MSASSYSFAPTQTQATQSTALESSAPSLVPTESAFSSTASHDSQSTSTLLPTHTSSYPAPTRTGDNHSSDDDDDHHHHLEHRDKHVAKLIAAILGPLIVSGVLIPVAIKIFWSDLAKGFHLPELDFWNLIKDLAAGGTGAPRRPPGRPPGRPPMLALAGSSTAAGSSELGSSLFGGSSITLSLAEVDMLAGSTWNLVQQWPHGSIFNPEKIANLESVEPHIFDIGYQPQWSNEQSWSSSAPEEETIPKEVTEPLPEEAAEPLNPHPNADCEGCHLPSPPTEPAELNQWQHDNDVSIEEAFEMPTPGPSTQRPGDLSPTVTMPKEYEHLTLDGKIAYTRKIGQNVFDSDLVCGNGQSAAVGANNMPLAVDNQGFKFDEAGNVVEYLGTTTREMEDWGKSLPDANKVRKHEYWRLRARWENMQTKADSIRAEEKSALDCKYSDCADHGPPT